MQLIEAIGRKAKDNPGVDVLTNESKALGYGHQGLKEHDVSKVEEVKSSQGRNVKITVRMQKQRAITTSPLYYKYDIQKYDLHPNYHFDKVAHMRARRSSAATVSTQRRLPRRPSSP
jgi:hypothetical protein